MSEEKIGKNLFEYNGIIYTDNIPKNMFISITKEQYVEYMQQKETIEQQQKVIDKMAEAVYDYANLGTMGICPAEIENGCINFDLCDYFGKKDINCLKCVKQYFYRKVENMTEEEKKEYIEHEIIDRLYCLEEKDFNKDTVTQDYIEAVLKAGKEAKELINKQQEEIEYQKDLYEKLFNGYNERVKETENSISKDKIREILNKYGKKEIQYAFDFYKEIEELLEE